MEKIKMSNRAFNGLLITSVIDYGIIADGIVKPLLEFIRNLINGKIHLSDIPMSVALNWIGGILIAFFAVVFITILLLWLFRVDIEID